ncbi:MAG TPA: tetratricopeptide repeat protein [Thermoanaerobaculia bacterium]
MTRAMYRSQWFELLDDFQENDERDAAQKLSEMMRAARSVGVRHLADYSRVALHAARRAEQAGKTGGAALAYAAAVQLDGSSFDAASSRAVFLARQGRLRDAIAAGSGAVTTLFASAESRLSLVSSLALAVIAALIAGAIAVGLALLLKYFRRIWHDLVEAAGRPFGPRAAKPIAFLLLLLPLFLTLGPVWLLLYWTVLAFAYSSRSERWVLAFALFVLGMAPIAIEAVARENLVRRSPVYLAAVDLAERREDFSVEDGVASIASASPDRSDAWFLLGRYAERAGDNMRALSAYGRAIETDPKDYRALVNRGNVRFIEGDYGQAIADYEEATRRDPRSAEAFYNLSLARSEIYDFKGQESARAQALAISRRDVDTWSSRPVLNRVVAAPYSVGDAREKARSGGAPAPGRGSAGARPAIVELALSPWCLAPWGALAVAWLFGAVRSRFGTATECSRCGRAFCRRCKRSAGPPTLCGPCARLSFHKEEVDDATREADLLETGRRARRRRYLVRVGSALIPGLPRFVFGQPWAALGISFLFFLALALAFGGPWLFDLAPLAPSSASLPGRIAAVAVALLVSLLGLNGARRVRS